MGGLKSSSIADVSSEERRDNPPRGAFQRPAGPRITIADRVSESRHRVFELPVVRYGFATAISVCALILQRLIGHSSALGVETPVLLLFMAIVAASVFGGFGPGLVSTLFIGAGWHFADPFDGGNVLNQPEFRLLMTEGFLMSLLGGTLATVRRRAYQSARANLHLEQQILEIGDEERQRIGHDLHDGLGQHLTGISLLTESIAQQMQGGGTPSPASIETITRLVSEAVSSTRDLARSLSPVTLERDGFNAAMEELAANASTLLNIRCSWDYSGPDIQLDRKKAVHLYRIVQEAVSNAVKHGKARHVDITMTVTGRKLDLEVFDDGSGLSEKTMANPGLGLRIMQYRARMVGATVSAQRVSGTGGTIVACIYLLDDHEAETFQKRSE